MDSDLLGPNLVKMTSTTGNTVTFGETLDETGSFDVTDRVGRIEVERRGAGWSVWGGAFAATRDVSWLMASGETDPFHVDRDSAGWLVGTFWNARKCFKVNAEYEHGSFERYIFRTDPETVDRLTLRIRSELGKGWHLYARGRFEKADNPVSESELDRRSNSYGLGLGWDSADGRSGFALDAEMLDLTTDNSIRLPEGEWETARYDLNLFTLGLHARTTVGKVRLQADVERLKDSGETWPLGSWAALASASVDGPKNTEFSVFVRHRSYDEVRATVDDFDATRYGVVVRWRF